jgi:2-polyprenyl-3-methyl-5-hydroxy-6-metoxy-1,4-benzoquinol methylase
MDYDKFYQEKEDSYFSNSRSEIIPFVPSNIKMALDVGCGNGAFGKLLKKERQCSVWGIEPNKQVAIEAGEKLDKVINSLFIENIPALNGHTFDAIFFNDVLEHLINPGESLNYCKKLLNPQGCIIASIPNIRWYPVILKLIRYKDFKYEKSGVMDSTHLRFFTRNSMIRLFESNGYKVVNIEGINRNTNFRFFNIINSLLLRSQDDMAFPQFVVVAEL